MPSVRDLNMATGAAPCDSTLRFLLTSYLLAYSRNVCFTFAEGKHMIQKSPHHERSCAVVADSILRLLPAC